MDAEAQGGPELRVLRGVADLEAPLPSVWTAWTTESGIRSFFAPRITLDLRVDGAFEPLFILDEEPGQQGAEGCRILSLEPPRRLSFTWNAPPHIPAARNQRTWVDLRFSETGPASCRLILLHGGFGEGDHWDATVLYFQNAWSRVLDQLAKALASGSPAPST